MWSGRDCQDVAAARNIGRRWFVYTRCLGGCVCWCKRAQRTHAHSTTTHTTIALPTNSIVLTYTFNKGILSLTLVLTIIGTLPQIPWRVLHRARRANGQNCLPFWMRRRCSIQSSYRCQRSTEPGSGRHRVHTIKRKAAGRCGGDMEQAMARLPPRMRRVHLETVNPRMRKWKMEPYRSRRCGSLVRQRLGRLLLGRSIALRNGIEDGVSCHVSDSLFYR
jgi:hypothetical protein